LSGTQPFSVDARVAHPHQANQRRPCVFSEPSHLAVPPLVDRDLEPGVTALAPKGAHGSGFGLSTINLNPLSPARKLPFVELSTHFGNIDLRDLAFDVGQGLRKVAVVREKKDPARVE